MSQRFPSECAFVISLFDLTKDAFCLFQLKGSTFWTEIAPEDLIEVSQVELKNDGRRQWREDVRKWKKDMFL